MNAGPADMEVGLIAYSGPADGQASPSTVVSISPRSPQAHAAAPRAWQPAPQARQPAPRMVLMPTELRMDSRVLAVTVTTHWAAAMVFCVLLMLKLDGDAHMAWWTVFMPLWIGHMVYAPMQIAVIVATGDCVRDQLGPPPLPGASPGLMLQYNTLAHIRTRSHRLDAVCSLLDTAAAIAVEAMVCWQLGLGTIAAPTVAWRVILMPLWVSWGLCTLLGLARHSSERQWGAARDLGALFAAFLAFKLDSVAPLSWAAVFLVPWSVFGTLIILAATLTVALAMARTRMRRNELWLSVAFLAVVLAAIGQLPAWVLLTQRLNGDASISAEAILLPASISWGNMWLAGMALAVALAAREVTRQQAVASGAVWTRHEAVAARMDQRALAQQAVDAMDAEQLAAAAAALLQGQPKPSRMVRMGPNLYRTPSAADAAKHLHDSSAAAHSELVELRRPAEGRASDGGDADLPTIVVTVVVPSSRGAAESGSPFQQPEEQAQCVGTPPAHAASSDACGSAEEGALARCALQQGRCCSTDSLDGTCAICFGASGTCVLLDCGHGAYCRPCAYRIFLRPPQQCPMCRATIRQVVELASGKGHIGQVIDVQ